MPLPQTPARFHRPIFSLIALAIYLTSHLFATAQSSTGTISGRVSNKATGEFLRNARINVQGTKISTTAGSGGEFVLIGVPAGEAQLFVTYTGLDTLQQTVTVAAGETSSVNLDLTSASYAGDVVQLGQYVVSTDKEGNAKAIQDQKEATNMKKVIATDVFGDVSEGNVGEFLKFMPGIAIDYVEADARQIRIRGYDPKYAAITMDGAPIASAGSSDIGVGRAFELEQLSIGSIETIEMSKTPTPDVTATAVAGVINLRSKGAFDRKGRRIKLQGGLGFNEYYTEPDKTLYFDNRTRRQIQPNATFEFSDIYLGGKLGVIAGFNYSEALTAQKAEVVGYAFDTNASNNDTEIPRITNFNYRDGPKITVRENFNVRFDYKFSETLRAWARVDYNIYDATFHNRDAFFSINNAANNVYNSGGTLNDPNIEYSLNSQTTNFGRVSVGSGGSNRKFGETTTFNTGFNHRLGALETNVLFQYSKATNHYRDITEGFLNGAGAGPTTGSPFRWTRNPGDTGVKITQLSGTNWRDQSAWVIDNPNTVAPTPAADTGWPMNSFKRDSSDKRWTGNADFRYPFNWRVPVLLKWGGAITEQYRNNERNQRRWRFLGANGVRDTTDAGVGPFLEPVPMNFDMGGNIDGLSTADRFSLARVLRENPNYFSEDLPNALTTQLQNNVDLKEQIDAAYWQTQIKFGALTVAPGLRGERTRIMGRGYQDIGPAAAIAASGTTNTADLGYIAARYGRRRTQNNEYSNLFKYLHLVYDFTKDLKARASYHQSITRADPGNIIPIITINNETALPPTLTASNPELKPELSRNINVGMEYYFKNIGLVSITVFRSDLEDIQRRLSFDLGPDGLPGSGDFPFWRVTQTINAGKSHRYGGEIDYAQTLSFIPKSFGTVRVTGNYTQTKVDDELNSLNSPSKLANGTIDYRIGDWRASVRGNWSGTRLLVVSALTGANAGRREYLRDRLTYDVGLDYRVTRNISLSLNGRNVLNEETQTYILRRDILLRTVKTGAMWTVGATATF